MLALVQPISGGEDGKREEIFTGRVDGVILKERRGLNGFGYDPVFFVPELDSTMAELTGEEKNSVSHRGKALKKFREWLIENLDEDSD